MKQEQLTKIIKALKDNTKGMTVTEISKEINLNRNSVAKYLEVLLISGHVEMRTFGPAKVFFVSQRVPMSALIDFSSDYIIILDRDLKTVKANLNFLKIIEKELTDIVGQNLESLSIPVFNKAQMQSNIKTALNGKRVTKEIELLINKTQHSFNLKIIPTTFEDGLPGVTMILEDITERKQMKKRLFLLSKAVKMSSESVLITDMETKILDVNDATVRMHKATNKKDLIGKMAFEIIKPVEEQKTNLAIEELIKKGSKNIFQFNAHTLDGTKYLEVRFGLIKDQNNNPMGLVAISREATEQ